MDSDQQIDTLVCLRKVERTLAFSDGRHKTLAHHIEVAVVRKLEIVDARHDTGKVVVGGIRGFTRTANDGEHGLERTEACIES